MNEQFPGLPRLARLFVMEARRRMLGFTPEQYIAMLAYRGAISNSEAATQLALAIKKISDDVKAIIPFIQKLEGFRKAQVAKQSQRFKKEKGGIIKPDRWNK